MSEYDYCWRVQDKYGLNDIQREKLVSSLAGIDGAIKEYDDWQLLEVTLPEIWSYGIWLKFRAPALYEKMKAKADNDIHLVRAILRGLIMTVYEGERPEMVGLPDVFSGKDDFLDFEQQFRPIYCDSLLLKREAVREYCEKHAIRQVTAGVVLEGAPSPPAGQEVHAADAPADTSTAPVSTGSRKDKDRIAATRQACEAIRQEINQGKHLFGNGKINKKTFFFLVSNALGNTRIHQETALAEWKKVPAHLKHNGRVSDKLLTQ